MSPDAAANYIYVEPKARSGDGPMFLRLEDEHFVVPLTDRPPWKVRATEVDEDGEPIGSTQDYDRREWKRVTRAILVAKRPGCVLVQV